MFLISKKTVLGENTFKSVWIGLTGNPLVFSLEFRIFHSVMILVLFLLASYSPFNFYIGLPGVGILCLVTFVLILYLYYRSRYERKMESSVIMLCTVVYSFIFVNYFSNSGLGGPTDTYLVAALVIFITIFPYRQFKLCLWVNIIIFLLFHVIEYFVKGAVYYPGKTHLGYFLDKTSTFLIVAILFYFIVKYIRLNYDYERQRAEANTIAIEEQHRYILIQNQHLENLNAEKNKLMSILSHDLRSPLSSIKGYLELVNDNFLDDKERVDVQSNLLQVTDDTLNMLSKLLTWSKAQMDGVVVKPQFINLVSVLKSTLEMERMIALKKDITLAIQIDPQINLLADCDMLELVIRNLVSNAIKFTPSGGKIEVNTEMLNYECKITVKDNGRGIPYSKQAELFSFKTEPGYGTHKEKGVGLGLILCKEFTELQGGRIDFESKPNQGCSFFVYLPVA